MIDKLMQYPLISEYLAAIRDAHDNLDKLSHLVPVLDNYGDPYRSSGAFAVVFKMKDEQTGKCYALKCFPSARFLSRNWYTGSSAGDFFR